MHLVAQSRNAEYTSKLLKIFKTWQALDLFSGLNEIAVSLNFAAIVSLSLCRSPETYLLTLVALTGARHDNDGKRDEDSKLG